MKKNKKVFIILACVIVGIFVFEIVQYGNRNQLKMYDVAKVYKNAYKDFEIVQGKKIGNMDYTKCNFSCYDPGDSIYYIRAKIDNKREFSQDEYKERFEEQFKYYFADRDYNENYLKKHMAWLWEYCAPNEDLKMQNSKGAQLSMNRGRLARMVYRDEEEDDDTKCFDTIRMHNRNKWFSKDSLEKQELVNEIDRTTSYKLVSGITTVEEVLSNFEGFFAKDPFVKYDEDFELFAEMFNYYNKDDLGIAILDLGMKYKGVPFDEGGDYAYVDCEVALDEPIRGTAIILGKDWTDIDYLSYPPVVSVHEEEAINKIVRLKDAITIFSQKLSDANQYEVEKIEFVYRMFIPLIDENGNTIELQDTQGKDISGRASWKFVAKNLTDEKDYVVFVDAQTGDVSYYKAWKESE